MVFSHEHDIVYYAKCSEKSFPHYYVSESGTRVLEPLKVNNGGDTSPTFLEADHQFVPCVDLRIAGRNYRNNERKGNIGEAL